MEELETVVREESKQEAEPSGTQIYINVLKVRGHKGHNRIVLAMSIRETSEGVRIMWLYPLYHTKSAIIESKSWEKTCNIFPPHISKKVTVFKWLYFSRCFELYLIDHHVENLYGIAQMHCMRLSAWGTSCFWYHSFTSNCLFLIWLHASCCKSCELTKMTANNLVYRAV